MLSLDCYILTRFLFVIIIFLNIKLMLAKKKILCYTISIERKREYIMKKMNQVLETKQEPKLQPFPFIECEDYLLKLKSGDYAVAYWDQGQFYSGFGDLYIEEEIVGIVALKDLGL